MPVAAPSNRIYSDAADLERAAGKCEILSKAGELDWSYEIALLGAAATLRALATHYINDEESFITVWSLMMKEYETGEPHA